MRPAAAFALILPLAGCIHAKAPPVGVVAEGLTRRYYALPVNQFFYDYGKPFAEFTLADGRRVYRWSSLELPVHLASAGSGITGFERNGRGETADNDRGAAATYYCELRVYVSPQEEVESFYVTVDSMGKWSGSRCGEIFD